MSMSLLSLLSLSSPARFDVAHAMSLCNSTNAHALSRKARLLTHHPRYGAAPLSTGELEAAKKRVGEAGISME